VNTSNIYVKHISIHKMYSIFVPTDAIPAMRAKKVVRYLSKTKK